MIIEDVPLVPAERQQRDIQDPAEPGGRQGCCRWGRRDGWGAAVIMKPGPAAAG
jgi:hypothetical protein